MKNIAIMLPSLSGGGAERVASELSLFLVREGYHVYVFTEKKKTDYRFDGEVVVLNPLKSNFKKIADVYDLYYLTKEIKRYKTKYHIDVAISFMEKYNIANILSKGREKVIVRVCTILSMRNDMKGVLYNRFLLRVLYNRADNVVVPSRYGKRDLVKNYGIKDTKLKIIPNAVIERSFDNSIPWKYGDKVILSVNRIHPIKQQEILIDVVTELVQIVPKMKLLLVGDDNNCYAKKLKWIVKKRGLESTVIFTGQVNDVEYYMHHSQVFVISSVTEGFPNVIVEAMNQGLPIISTNFPGAATEILGATGESAYGKYGIVVPWIDESKKDAVYQKGIRQLRSALLEVLTNPKLAEQYSIASKVRSRFYSRDKIEALWRRII